MEEAAVAAVVLDAEAAGAARRLGKLTSMIRSLDEAVATAEAQAAALPPAGEHATSTPPSAGEQAAATASSPVAVSIGTTAMATAEPSLVRRITDMINGSYFEALRELLPPSATSYERVSTGDVINRLEMGDAGARANRVLHLAFRGETLVGCCSSTYQPPWTPDGCGHWGLLVVHKDAQGTGVASALIGAAERRLAGACSHVQIEYDYTPGDAHSEKLMGMYETKHGFRCSTAPPRRRRRGADDAPVESQFRKCHKKLPPRLVTEQRPVHLRGIRESFVSQLPDAGARLTAGLHQPGGVDRVGRVVTLRGLTQHAAAYNGRRARVLYFSADGTYAVAVEPAGGQAAAPASDDDDDDESDEEEELPLGSGVVLRLGHSLIEMDEAPVGLS